MHSPLPRTMLDSTIVRAFTKRRPTNPPSLASPPPLLSQEAFQRRQAALRQMGLIPTLSLSQQEAQLDQLIPPSSPVNGTTLAQNDATHVSEADRIKKAWVAKNAALATIHTPDDVDHNKERMASFKFGPKIDPINLPLPLSPPLTPLDGEFTVGTLATTVYASPDPTVTILTTGTETTTETTPKNASPIGLTSEETMPTTTASLSSSSSESVFASTPLTPQCGTFSNPLITTSNSNTSPAPSITPTYSPTNPNIVLEKQPPLLVHSFTEQESQPQPSYSPISTEFHSPEVPHSPSSSHLHPPRLEAPLGVPIPVPFRSRSPSLVGSDSKSTRSRSKSRTRAASPLRFLTRGGAVKEGEDEPLPPLPLSPARSDFVPPPPLTTAVDPKEGQGVKLLTPAPTPTSPHTQTPVPQPQPQRKKTVFARFKRSNTTLASDEPKARNPQTQVPSRSKSLFTSVKKTVLGLGASPNASAGSGPTIINNGATATVHASLALGANSDTVQLLPSLPSSLPSLPSWSTSTVTAPTSDSNPTILDLPPSTCTDDSVANSATPAPTQDAELVGVEIQVEGKDDLLPFDPFGSESVHPQQPEEKGMGELPPLPTSPVGERKFESEESESNYEVERERRPSFSATLANTSTSEHSTTTGPISTASGKGTGKGIGISLILNRERKCSTPSPSSPPSSFSYLSPPTSPTQSTAPSRIRGRLGRKGTVGAEGLLSVLGGVSGLLGGSSSEGPEGINEEARPERHAVAPTIHNEASIMLHMSHIEDEETRRVTEVAFM